MSGAAILRSLRHGPATNAELQEACCDHGGGIARDAAALIHAGRVRRIDGKKGRGTIAVYALTEGRHAEN